MKTEYPFLCAVIDIGAHSVRMMITEVRQNKTYRVLEDLERMVPLGADVFKKGTIDEHSILILCDVMKLYNQKMIEYNVENYTVIATSAVREADNSDIFIERIEFASGIKVKIFEGSDSAKLDCVTATRFSPEVNFQNSRVVVCSIGTGSMQLSRYKNGQLRFTSTIKQGTLRLSEIRETLDDPSAFISDRYCSDSSLGQLRYLPHELCSDTIIARGSSVRTVLELYKKILKINDNTNIISAELFNRFYNELTKMNREKLVKYIGDKFDLVEALPNCCYIIKYLFSITGSKELVVPDVSTAELLIYEQINSKSGINNEFRKQIISSCEHMAFQYNCYDMSTQNTVALADKIFNKFKSFHNMGDREHLLLHVAALLYRCGMFVSNDAYHKHSYYLISNFSIPGLTNNDQQIAANTARYHRKSRPVKSHPKFMQLNTKSKSIVKKLSMILKLAHVLSYDISSTHKMIVRVNKDTVQMKLEGLENIVDWESIEECRDFFMQVFCMKLIIR